MGRFSLSVRTWVRSKIIKASSTRSTLAARVIAAVVTFDSDQSPALPPPLTSPRPSLAKAQELCAAAAAPRREYHICSSLREGGGGTLGTLFTALAMLVAALRIIPESMFTSISTRFPLSVGVFQLCACDGAGVGGRCTEPASTLALMRFRHRRALCSLRININSESLCKYLREISPTLRQLRAKHRCNLPYQS